MNTTIVNINGQYITFPMLDGTIENTPDNYSDYDPDTQRKIIRHLIDYAYGECESTYHVFITTKTPIDTNALNNGTLSPELLNFIHEWNDLCETLEEEIESLLLFLDEEESVYKLLNTAEGEITIADNEVDIVIRLFHNTNNLHNSYGNMIDEVFMEE